MRARNWIAFLLIISCDAPEGRVSIASRDSAGVRIIENADAQISSLAVIQVDSPGLRIGTVTGPAPYQLFDVRGVTQLSDGTIAVLNGGSHEIRFYDSTGGFLRSTGRHGNGPGEFRFPVGMVRSADTLIVIDMSARRFTYIGPDGRLVRTKPSTVGLSGFVAFLDSSTFLAAEPLRHRSEGEGIFQRPYVARAVDIESGVADTLGTFGTLAEMRTFAGEIVATTRVPFTVHPGFRVSDGEIYVAEGHTSDIRVFDRDGQLIRVIRTTLAPSPVTAADYSRYVEHEIARLGMLPSTSEQAAHRGDLRRIYDAMNPPSVEPYYDELFLTAENDVWVRRFNAFAADFQEWIRFSASGRVVEIIRLPATVRVRDMQESSALGVTVDSLGVEYVERYDWSE